MGGSLFGYLSKIGVEGVLGEIEERLEMRVGMVGGWGECRGVVDFVREFLLGFLNLLGSVWKCVGIF